MPKKLSEERLNELLLWLRENGVTQHKNMSRDFSDGVALANFLKKFHPKLIELHNYPPRNNTQLKINNWQTLNFKVLSKLGMSQTKKAMENLAKATPGAIESLLYDIMQSVKANAEMKASEQVDEQTKIWTENDEVMTINVTQMIGDAMVQVPQKMILFSIYEQAVKQSQAKDTAIHVAQQKITHLENILKLKTERIEELCDQLAKVSVRSLLAQHNNTNLESSNSSVELTSQQQQQPATAKSVQKVMDNLSFKSENTDQLSFNDSFSFRTNKQFNNI